MGNIDHVIAILDYRTGNPQSVLYAFRRIGVDAHICRTPEEAESADRFVLPGVGAADTTMKALAELGWQDFLERRVREDQAPFLGICVGLQVLFDFSAEGDVNCLGWLPGRVEAIDATKVRTPHIGWNTVRVDSDHPLAESLPAKGHFYFVNSYYAVPADPAVVAGVTTYPIEFASFIAVGNIMATQFHAEKSGELGLAILSSFASIPARHLEC